MNIEYSSGFCHTCNQNRKIQRKEPNHILHLLITLVFGFFTMGIGAIVWIVVWILLSIRFGGWICSTCGSNKIEAKPNNFKRFIYIAIALVIIIPVTYNKEKNQEQEIKEDINSKYTIINESILTKDECIDSVIEYLYDKSSTSLNLHILSHTYLPKSDYAGIINIRYMKDESKMSFTGLCTKEDLVTIEEMENLKID